MRRIRSGGWNRRCGATLVDGGRGHNVTILRLPLEHRTPR